MGANAATATTWISRLPGELLKLVIRIYQWTLSPLLPSACRFQPSCSEYMHQAVAKHGALRGIYLGLRRVLRCNPWHPGGVDPVP